jgi:hypothetical protein
MAAIYRFTLAGVNAQIVQFQARGMNRDEICATLDVGQNRVSRILRFFHDQAALQTPRTPGQPKKVTQEILVFIDIRTLQSARLSLAHFGLEVQARFGTPLIHFSDESRLFLGEAKRWVWYRCGEENPSATAATGNFATFVMIFGVTGVGSKSKLWFIEGMVDAKYGVLN